MRSQLILAMITLGAFIQTSRAQGDSCCCYQFGSEVVRCDNLYDDPCHCYNNNCTLNISVNFYFAPVEFDEGVSLAYDETFCFSTASCSKPLINCPNGTPCNLIGNTILFHGTFVVPVAWEACPL